MSNTEETRKRGRVEARIEDATAAEIKDIAARVDRPESWVIRKCIALGLPLLRGKIAALIEASAAEGASE